MFRRLAAACALLAVALTAAGAIAPVGEREPREVVAAASGPHGLPPSRRLRTNGPSADDAGHARRQGSATPGPFRWLWLSTAAVFETPPAPAASPLTFVAQHGPLASPALAARSSRGPPARS